MIKLSDYVIQCIAKQGVKHVFILPGGGAMYLNDSLGNIPDIEFVCNLHEQASAIAAEAYAKVTNNLGVALVTTGPGGTNAVTGVAGAWLDSTPCLFISGQVKRADLKGDSGVRQLGVQEVDIVSIVKSITKYAVIITEPNTIRYHIEKAIYLAKSGRPGPVWIDIPLDVQAAMIEPETQEGFSAQEIEYHFDITQLSEKLHQLIELLNESERPVIVVGNGVRLASAQAEFLELINYLGIPVLKTWLGLDLIADDHPLCFGKPGSMAPRGANFTLQNSDLLLSIGARLDMAMTGYAHDKLARAAKKIIVDIDLAEINKMKTTIHLPICADAKYFLQELLKQKEKIQHKDLSCWLGYCQKWKHKYPVVLPEYWNQTEGVSAYVFSQVLAEELTGQDVIVSGSSGNAIETFLLVFAVKAGQRIFHTRGLGSMGFGLPASIGACLASGLKRTICVDGDGGFQMNIQELETAKRLNLPIKFFVFNNQGFASIRNSQQKYFSRLVGADTTSGLSLPDILNVASAYGLATTQISTSINLREQIREILNSNDLMLCEVIVPKNEVRAPSLSSLKKEDGTMVSKPLEDMWPFLDREEFISNMIVSPLLE
ncbi:thiamine pyrophosphate-binding protein [Nostoc sp. 'Peltigera membranacea cyanobiont' 213]|uniref:thiamine pyrophosphate-binding protein n=1 Tax=Nostoc sp. 'Peltigera membranacea cyanobiont' 213 TaxID=2014530 RepID=UPI000B959CCF|nr:thiamine pyrophosphate-binding protein [Nostoc sp. 'Peltigera membranacea cyanobiont' 213]OYD94322.1 thiamine pyrophosphate-binding protein [Nostoc sp. 'Peltigera membranacea cyanobiont' 213]